MLIPDHILEKVRQEGDCWVWHGYRNEKGYGRVRDPRSRRFVLAHRLFYERIVGLVPRRFELDHLCRNRACVNPAHLEAVSHWENCRRGIRAHQQKSMTHCRYGHEYTPENTYVRPSGYRECRACAARTQRALYRRKRSRILSAAGEAAA